MSVDKFIKYVFPTIPVRVADTKDCILNAILYKDNYAPGEDGIEEGYKLNIALCIENCSSHPMDYYPHYQKYGNYGDPRIHVYFYNHINRCIFNEKYIAIPLLYPQLDYLRRFYAEIKPTTIIPFYKKKLCLFASWGGYRSHVKQQIIRFMKSLGPGACDTLEVHKPSVGAASCYHSAELLNVIQQYKFVFVCENSLGDGYITEKIFNGFFGRAIPIYNGSPAIERYFNKDSFINANDPANLARIPVIMNNEVAFQRMIDAEKIGPYDNEDYAHKLRQFMETKLQS